MTLQKKVAILTTTVIVVSCLVAVLSTFVFHDHTHRKAFVGSVGLVASVAMYGSPLVAMVRNTKQKIKDNIYVLGEYFYTVFIRL